MGRRYNSGNCKFCGTYRVSLHRDHIIPSFKGGLNASSNIQLICANCHEDKTREERKGQVLCWPSKEQKIKQSKSLKKYWKTITFEERSKRAKLSATKRTGPFPSISRRHISALRDGYIRYMRKTTHKERGNQVREGIKNKLKTTVYKRSKTAYR
jgi:hypothetical protein